MFQSSPIVKKIFYANVILFIITVISHNIVEFPLLNLLALYPPDSEHFHFYQILTNLFSHSGLFHVLFNMLAFLSFGPDVENQLGERKFLVFYLLMGFAGCLSQMIFSPGPMLGASGSIFGVMVYFTMFNPNAQLSLFLLPIHFKAKNFMIGILILELIMAFIGGGNVGHFCHLGGALTGFILKKINDNYL